MTNRNKVQEIINNMKYKKEKYMNKKEELSREYYALGMLIDDLNSYIDDLEHIFKNNDNGDDNE